MIRLPRRLRSACRTEWHNSSTTRSSLSPWLAGNLWYKGAGIPLDQGSLDCWSNVRLPSAKVTRLVPQIDYYS